VAIAIELVTVGTKLEDLHFEYRLLTEKDHQLPFGRHVITVFDDVIYNRCFTMQELVRTQEIIIRHPESKVVVGAIIIIEAICRPI